MVTSRLAAHNFFKVTFVKVVVKNRSFDVVCFSETFLDSIVPINDENIAINWHSLLRTDHPKNIKVEFIRESIKIERNNLTNTKACLVTEVNVNNEKCFITCLFRSPSQNPDELEQLCANFGLLLSNINNLRMQSAQNILVNYQ